MQEELVLKALADAQELEKPLVLRVSEDQKIKSHPLLAKFSGQPVWVVAQKGKQRFFFPTQLTGQGKITPKKKESLYVILDDFLEEVPTA